MRDYRLGLPYDSSHPLVEAKLETHDFELLLNTNEKRAQRRLYVLLLTPASVESEARHDTTARLERFSALTAGHDLVIALLLSEESLTGVHGRQADITALLQLQNLCVLALLSIVVPKSLRQAFALVNTVSFFQSILERLSGYIPILPLQSPETLLPALQSFVEDQTTGNFQVIPPAPADLIRYCTITAPAQRLDQYSVNILSDLFPTVRDICQGVQTEGGRSLVREYIDPQMANNTLNFWGNASNEG